MHPYAMLAVAIISEVIATSALKMSAGMTKIVPTVVVVVGYGLSFYMLAKVLETLSVGMVYATWTGLGVAAIALIGWFMFGERLGWLGFAGMALIVIGVGLLHLAQDAA